MALFRCGGGAGKYNFNKFTQVATQVNSGAVGAVYDIGSGVTSDWQSGPTSMDAGLCTISYSSPNFTLTFKEKCHVIALSGSGHTLTDADKNAGETLTIPNAATGVALIYN